MPPARAAADDARELGARLVASVAVGVGAVVVGERDRLDRLGAIPGCHESGMPATMCGFARDGRVNVYTAPERAPIGPRLGSSPWSSKPRKVLKLPCSGPWKSADPVVSIPAAVAASCRSFVCASVCVG